MHSRNRPFRTLYVFEARLSPKARDRARPGSPRVPRALCHSAHLATASPLRHQRNSGLRSNNVAIPKRLTLAHTNCRPRNMAQQRSPRASQVVAVSLASGLVILLALPSACRSEEACFDGGTCATTDGATSNADASDADRDAWCGEAQTPDCCKAEDGTFYFVHQADCRGPAHWQCSSGTIPHSKGTCEMKLDAGAYTSLD